MICFILTSSALKFKVSDLRNHWRPIGILASLALVFVQFSLVLRCTVISSDWQPCRYISPAITRCCARATDPIGIKGVLSSVRAPHHLIVKLEGEYTIISNMEF